MLYYVKTGKVDAFTNASNPRQAAVKTLLNNNCDNFGICTIVSEKKISKSTQNDHLYFLTEDIISEFNIMRLVS